jgi:hypothetical protein
MAHSGAAWLDPVTNAGYVTGTGIQKEDFWGAMTIISPADTPFIANAQKSDDVMSYVVSWPEDTLPSVITAAGMYSSTYTPVARTVPTRPTNIVGKFDDYFAISNTDLRIAKRNGLAGIGDLLREHMDRSVKNMWRSIETRVFVQATNLRTSAFPTSTADAGPRMAALAAFITTNASFCDATAIGGGGATSTDGTANTITEKAFYTLLGNAWASGGAPADTFANRFALERVSAFTGNQTRIIAAEEGKLHRPVYSYANWYTDTMRFHIDRWVPTSGTATTTADGQGGALLMLDMDRVRLRFLQRPAPIPINGQGDFAAGGVVSECTLMVQGEAGHARMFGCPPTG